MKPLNRPIERFLILATKKLVKVLLFLFHSWTASVNDCPLVEFFWKSTNLKAEFSEDNSKNKKVTRWTAIRLTIRWAPYRTTWMWPPPLSIHNKCNNSNATQRSPRSFLHSVSNTFCVLLLEVIRKRELNSDSSLFECQTHRFQFLPVAIQPASNSKRTYAIDAGPLVWQSN